MFHVRIFCNQTDQGDTEGLERGALIDNIYHETHISVCCETKFVKTPSLLCALTRLAIYTAKHFVRERDSRL
jgi:hypothetical protein